jgi:hypothetical protein
VPALRLDVFGAHANLERWPWQNKAAAKRRRRPEQGFLLWFGGLVLGFPLGSLLIAGVRRMFRFWYAPVFWLKRR